MITIPHRFRLTLLATILLTGASATRLCAADDRSQSPPNFVVIFADDLGYGDIGCFGSPTIQTPNIDKMAAEGMRLTSFYAQTVCGPSRAALMTGCYPLRVAINKNKVQVHPELHRNEITIAEVLKPAGYTSAAFGKWDLAGHNQVNYVPSLLPLHQGFDEFFGTPTSNDSSVNLIRGAEVIEKHADMRHLTRRYTDEAIEFIQRNKQKPFFVYLAHTMPHVKLAVSDEFKGKSAGGLYGDVVEEIDANVGRILRTLKQEGIDENTYVVFTSDNGPWYFGRSNGHLKRFGKNAIAYGGSATPLRGAKTSTWEGGLRVPCIIRAPGKVPADSHSDAVTSTMDLLPTFAKLAGTAAPADRVIDGKDVRDRIHGAPEPEGLKEPFYYYRRTRLEAVRLGKWKLHRARPADTVWANFSKSEDAAAITAPLLFDLEADLGEQNNVAAEHPKVVAELLTLIEKARADIGDDDRIGVNARFFDPQPRRPDLANQQPQQKQPKKSLGPNDRPNVVIIMADDLGYTDLGCFGCKDIRTPNIDSLAADGLRFTNAYATGSMCGPSRAGFITGRFQSSFGYYVNPASPLDPRQGLPAGTMTVAKLMQQQDYVTGGVGKWHMGTADHQHPGVMGYADWHGFLGGGLTYYPLDHPNYKGRYKTLRRPWGVRDLHHTLPILHNQTPVQWEQYVTRELTDAGVDFIEKNHDQPFFLFMSYNAPHLELEAPEETIAKYPIASMTKVPGVSPKARSIYAAMVDELDQGVGRLLESLEIAGVADNTVVWFLSDHGGMKRTSDNRPLRGAKGSDYEGGLRVPLIVRWPAKVTPGTIRHDPLTSLDIGATAVAMAGGKINKAELHGVDLTSYLTGKNIAAPHKAIYWRTAAPTPHGTSGKDSGIVREGDFKLLIESGINSLFNLAEDISESNDIASSHPKLVQRLRTQWKQWDRSSKPPLWNPTRKPLVQYADYEWLKGSPGYQPK